MEEGEGALFLWLEGVLQRLGRRNAQCQEGQAFCTRPLRSGSKMAPTTCDSGPSWHFYCPLCVQ
ncbi:hypothetical protein Q9966_005419 [Columba livia]|nr:hypothetical protein Q9966_005419 [Columba livia]